MWDREALAATFMVHEAEDPIHATLTDDFEDETPAAAALAKTALKLFKNVMGFMGDRKMNYPTMLAKEVLELGLANAPLRNELYLQLIKQLTKNQNPYGLRGEEKHCVTFSTTHSPHCVLAFVHSRCHGIPRLRDVSCIVSRTQR